MTKPSMGGGIDIFWSHTLYLPVHHYFVKFSVKEVEYWRVLGQNLKTDFVAF